MISREAWRLAPGPRSSMTSSALRSKQADATCRETDAASEAVVAARS
jgi:hypothetical protein